MENQNQLSSELKIRKLEEQSDITFVIGGNDILKLCANGKIFVRGKEAATDIEVVNAMREFLVEAKRTEYSG